MALMEALLKIKAMVTGEEGLTSMAKSLGGLKKGAENASGGLKSMLTSAGGLSGALGSLVPLVSGVGLAAMAKGAIDAADNLNDLSQKTGVSVESLSQWKQAAEAGGTTIDVVGNAMLRLSRGMVQAATDTDEYGQTAEEALQQATQAVEDGEDRQIQAVQDAADKRLAALEKESDDRLKEINKRYRAEQQLLDDKYDDEAQRETEAAKDRQQQEERAIKKQFDARRKAIQNDKSLSDETKSQLLESLREQEDETLKTLDRGYQKQQKERTRQFRDAQQQQEEALDERKRAEESKIKERLSTEKTLTKEHTDSQVKQIKESTKEQLASLKDLSEGPKGVAKALRELGISVTDASGKMKSTDQVMKEVADKFAAMPEAQKRASLAFQLFSKSGASLIPVLNDGRKGVESFSVTMTTKFAKAADELNDDTVVMAARLLALSVTIGEKLMPHLNNLTDMVISLADGFAAMPGWLQGTIAGVAGLLLVLPTLVSTLSGLIGIVKVISGLKLAATIASWAAAAGPAMAVISAAFTGLLTFLTGTLLPALLAFFSGPVGWTVLAVAAVVAMAIAFRKPLGQFITWLGSVFKKGWDGFVDNILKKPLTAYFKWWRKNWEAIGGFVLTVFKNVRGAVVTVFGAITGTIRGVIAGAFGFAASIFNDWIAAVNNIIKGLKNIPFLGLRLLPVLQQIKIPKFAEGGVVRKPTLAMVGEGGEPEYIIPQSKLKTLFGGLSFLTSSGKPIESMSTDMVDTLLARMTENKPLATTPRSASGSSSTNTGSQSNNSAPLLELPTWLQEQTMKQYSLLTNATAKAIESADIKVGVVQLSDPSITITTGPVLQFNGQDYVTVNDLRDALQATAKAVLNSLRNPSTRISLGLV